MPIAKRRVYFKHAEFQSAWEGTENAGSGSHGTRQGSGKHDILNETGFFLGGALLDYGFTLFKNGGLPLLERRFGPLIEEIVLRPKPRVSSEGHVSVRLTLHLNHLGLQNSRARYWAQPSRSPSVVASIDVGQLEIPPCWVIWNVGQDHQVLVEMVEWLKNLALPWFDLFENEAELHRRLVSREVPLLRPDIALELMLAQFGEYEGARYFENVVMQDPRVAETIRDRTRKIKQSKISGEFGDDVVANLASLAATFHLLRR